ncbi:hypothetical protein K1719_007016 [Acacia pycnantha]|nr:hypothetical protein K1719_007016 [Acacia pycnantha]
MELLLLVDLNHLCWSSFLYSMPSAHTPKLRPFLVQSSKQSSDHVSSGLQKDTKKDLSRILRTEVAIKAALKEIGEASLLFDIMLSEGLKPTVDVYTALVIAYAQSGLLPKTFDLVGDMKSAANCKPDIPFFSIVAQHTVGFD